MTTNATQPDLAPAVNEQQPDGTFERTERQIPPEQAALAAAHNSFLDFDNKVTIAETALAAAKRQRDEALTAVKNAMEAGQRATSECWDNHTRKTVVFAPKRKGKIGGLTGQKLVDLREETTNEKGEVVVTYPGRAMLAEAGLADQVKLQINGRTFQARAELIAKGGKDGKWTTTEEANARLKTVFGEHVTAEVTEEMGVTRK